MADLERWIDSDKGREVEVYKNSDSSMFLIKKERLGTALALELVLQYGEDKEKFDKVDLRIVVSLEEAKRIAGLESILPFASSFLGDYPSTSRLELRFAGTEDFLFCINVFLAQGLTAKDIVLKRGASGFPMAFVLTNYTFVDFVEIRPIPAPPTLG